MALKDLAADLENFKYGQSSPDKVDSQIKNGVDFFDNETGGATGFTPKAGDLESQYKKFVEGTVGNKWPEAARSNEKTRTAYGTQGEYSEANIPFNNGLANPPHIFGTDTFGTPWSLDFPQFQSPFMNTPLADFVSQYSITDPSNSLTHVVEPYIFSNEIRIANAHNSTDSLSRIGTYLPLYNNIQYPQNIPAPYTSSPNLSDFSGPVDGRLTTQIPINPRDSDGNNIGRLSQLNYPYPTSDSQNNHNWAIYGGYSSIFDYTEFRSRIRDSYGISMIGEDRSVFSPYHHSNNEFANIPLPGLFGPNYNNTTPNRWKVGSIHIMNDDTQSPIGGGVSQFANLKPVHEWNYVINDTENEQSLQFSNSQYTTTGYIGEYKTPEGFTGTQTTLNIPAIVSSATANENYGGSSNYLGESNLGPFFLGGSEIDAIDNVLRIKSENRDDYPNLYGNFGKRAWYDLKKRDFRNVPAGLGENNVPTTDDFRHVANTGPFSGNDNHPLILRDIGNNWGIDDDDQSGFFNGLDAVAGGFVRGAPTLTGMIDRSLTDKIRIGSWMLGTMDGWGYMVKQFALQALNPTLESKIWNPASALSISGVGDALGDLVNAKLNGTDATGTDLLNVAQKAAITAAIPIGHPERHLGGGRYEDIVPMSKIPGFILDNLPSEVQPLVKDLKFGKENTAFGSRLGMQSNPEVIKEKSVTVFGKTMTIGGKDLKVSLTLMNPNKYLFPISSAPKSIGKDGIPSFTGGLDLVDGDITKVTTKKGGTFNKKTSQNKPYEVGLITRHSTLAYDFLNKESGYTTSADTGTDRIESPSEINAYIDGGDGTVSKINKNLRNKFSKIHDGIGKVDSNAQAGIVEWDEDGNDKFEFPIKGWGKISDSNVDKINMIPAIEGTGQTNEDGTAQLPEIITENPDFIKFMFKDVTNDKYLVFRAILDGISDSVTPEYSDVKFIGRPDKAYIYTGVDRSINFNFKVYPKTKQELPILMEKLNYLVGMCYPSFTEGERMITPFMELTLGDMFNNTPGLLETLSLSVEDATTWEIEEGLQYPHFISVNCVFKHIGKYVPTANGKHYDLNWLDIGTKTNEDIPSNNNEIRTKYKYINAIGATSAE